MGTRRHSYGVLRDTAFSNEEHLHVSNWTSVERWSEWESTPGTHPTLDEILGFEEGGK